MKREKIKIDKEQWDDYTDDGPWFLNDEEYTKIETYLSRDCDGECNNVIVKRKSDSKFFKFTWQYYGGDYYYGDKLEEVFQETITIKKYK